MSAQHPDGTQRPTYTFLTKAEAAEALGATIRQISRWSSAGRLGHVRLGNAPLFTPDQIATFVRSCTIDAVPSND